jgi:hypothetical protein
MNNLLKNKSAVIAVFLGLYILSAGISWAIFRGGSNGLSGLVGLAAKRDQVDELPKTEECPTNGAMFTVPEREIWETRRPLTFMIENSAEARPLEGLHKADIVYELVAEGGVSRFLGVFYCGVSAENVRLAPIRSARIFFIHLASEYGDKPIFGHVGGANRLCGHCEGGLKPAFEASPKIDAISELLNLGWRVRNGNDFDTTWDIGYPVFSRDTSRPGADKDLAHTMFAFTDDIYAEAEERGLTHEEDGQPWLENFRQWKFKDDKPAGNPQATEISFEFWRNKPDYDVVWEYDSANNQYLRNNGGQPFVDWKSGTQIAAKNVVVQFVEEEGPVDKELHMYYEVVGEGDAIIFQNGEAIEGSWEKKTRDSRTIFYDEDGNEIEFVRGPIWIEGVPEGNNIVY